MDSTEEHNQGSVRGEAGRGADDPQASAPTQSAQGSQPPATETRNNQGASVNSSSSNNGANRRKTGRKPKPGYEFPCRFCDRMFMHKQSRMTHYRVHHHEEAGVEILRFKCKYENCDAVYKDHSALRHHVETTHENKLFQCRLCSATFKYRTALYHHSESEHGGKRAAAGDTATSEQPMRVVKKRGRGVSGPAAKKRHKPLTAAERAAAVAAAAVAGSDDPSLEPVVRLFECSDCHKRFQSKNSCQIHIETTHMDLKLKCTHPGCNKEFSCSSYLKNHLKSHTGAWQCKTCGIDHPSRTALVAHTVFHHDMKCYKCPNPGCGKEFGYKTSARTHWRTQHEEHFLRNEAQANKILTLVDRQAVPKSKKK